MKVKVESFTDGWSPERSSLAQGYTATWTEPEPPPAGFQWLALLCPGWGDFLGILQETSLLYLFTPHLCSYNSAMRRIDRKMESNSLCLVEAFFPELNSLRFPLFYTLDRRSLWPAAASALGSSWTWWAAAPQPLPPTLDLVAAVATEPIMPESHHDDFRIAL